MGFVPNMRVPCMFYVNEHLQTLMFEELEQYVSRGDVGGFLPAVKQLANVAALPGIVKASIALPDVHSGYGFAIGNVAAFDVNDPESIVSPGAPAALLPQFAQRRRHPICPHSNAVMVQPASSDTHAPAFADPFADQAASALISTAACACCAQIWWSLMSRRCADGAA